MGSMTLPEELPIINFSLLKPGSSSWVSTCKQVRCALEEMKNMVALWHCTNKFPHSSWTISLANPGICSRFPLKTKSRPVRSLTVAISDQTRSCRSMKAWSLTTLHPYKKLRSSGTSCTWPNGKTNFCEITDLFAKLVGDLENTVGKMIFESFGIPQEQYESLASSNSHLLRFLKYRTPEESDTVIRFPSHADKNFTSIVVQHDVGGLEVQTKDGDWISVESAPSQFLFLAADGLQVWSNDRVKVCQHRAKNCGDKTRYSLGMFTFNNGVFQVPN